MPRPLTAPTPEFFEAAIPNVHKELMLQLRTASPKRGKSRRHGLRERAIGSASSDLTGRYAMSGTIRSLSRQNARSTSFSRKGSLPRSHGRPRRLERAEKTMPGKTSRRAPLNFLDKDYDEDGAPVIFNFPESAGSEIGTLSLSCLSEFDSATFPPISLMYPESLASETPRSVTTRSAYFASIAGSLSCTQSDLLIKSANNTLRQKMQLLDPLSRGRNQIPYLNLVDSSSSASIGNSKQRSRTSEEMTNLLHEIKVLRGVADPNAKQGDPSGSEKRKCQKDRETLIGPTRQAGDLRGLSARVRVNMKVTKYRDPNQLHALRRSLGQIKPKAKGKKHKKEETMKDAEDSINEKGAEGQPYGRVHVILETPRAMASKLMRRKHLREQRMRNASARRKVLIQKEIEHFYNTSSAFKEARAKKEKNDRLSSRKVTRGWIKISWAYLSGVHFRRTIERGRKNRAEKKAQYMAQVRISSQYRRRKGLREFRARQRADYILKTGLKRLARRWKARRNKYAADTLLAWFRQTKQFSRRVLGYLMLKNAAIAVQRTWRNFCAIKEHQIKALSYKMKCLAEDAHKFAALRHASSGSRNKLPPMEPLPPWNIQYELLGSMIQPIRRNWLDSALPKYNLDRALYIAKRDRYARQKRQETLERRGMKKRPGIDLGALLIEPHRPRFDAVQNVNDTSLLKVWNDATYLAKFPKKWVKRLESIQKWLADRKANHFYNQRRHTNT